jgi:hypothetical protein
LEKEMTTQIRAFRPSVQNGTVNIAVTASNQVLTLGSPVPQGTQALRVANIGTQTVFIELGTSAAVAAVTTSMPLLANTTEVFTIKNDITSIAVIAGNTGSTIYVTAGEGL